MRRIEADSRNIDLESKSRIEALEARALELGELRLRRAALLQPARIDAHPGSHTMGPMRFALFLLLSSFAFAQPAYDLLIKGGHVIDPKNNVDRVADVAIAGGKIARVAPNIPEAEASGWPTPAGSMSRRV